MRNSQVRADSWKIVSWEPDTKTISHEKNSTTTVRIAVATVESVFRMPHLARIDVSPENRAEPKAKNSHIDMRLPFLDHRSLVLQYSTSCLNFPRFFPSFYNMKQPFGLTGQFQYDILFALQIRIHSFSILTSVTDPYIMIPDDRQRSVSAKRRSILGYRNALLCRSFRRGCAKTSNRSRSFNRKNARFCPAFCRAAFILKSEIDSVGDSCDTISWHQLSFGNQYIS